MAQLSFNLADVKPLIEHAKAAPEQQPTFGQLADETLWKPGAKPGPYGTVEASELDPSKLMPSLLFVKDRGAYLMSAGTPGQMSGDGEKRVVVYAAGCDPEKDEEWWDECRHKCGGDDFAESLSVAMFEQAMSQTPGAKRLVITLTTRTIKVRAA